jgi:sigma-54 specific flagellar transcriptional regulator A
MPLYTRAERARLQAISDLCYCNPFLPERIDYERRILGRDFTETDAVWSMRADQSVERQNIPAIMEKVEELADVTVERLKESLALSESEQTLYEDLVFYLLYHRYYQDFQKALLAKDTGKPEGRVGFYTRFEKDADFYFLAMSQPPRFSLEHLFAGLFQLRRAFHYIFSCIVGGAMSAARLRAAIWQSIFTHDMRRHWRVLYPRMGDITTLIIGATGTGKELVARAIGMSRFIPFDPKSQRFEEDYSRCFHALNISSLSPTLIESELFGHRRGSFTGAIEDRVGWLEQCRPLGTVFLDEVGELDTMIQVKLLRVLQYRTFQRLGESTECEFFGKVIAATNRDLAEEMQDGRFREDFYYRLCADIIHTPALREQLLESPDELQNIVFFIASNIAGDAGEDIATDVLSWIETELGIAYAWPGNFRELEQCVRNVMVRREYRPPERKHGSAHERLGLEMTRGDLTADDVLRRYCTLVYAKTGTYEEAARRLNLDRRTVKAKIDEDLLNELSGRRS